MGGEPLQQKVVHNKTIAVVDTFSVDTVPSLRTAMTRSRVPGQLILVVPHCSCAIIVAGPGGPFGSTLPRSGGGGGAGLNPAVPKWSVRMCSQLSRNPPNLKSPLRSRLKTEQLEVPDRCREAKRQINEAYIHKQKLDIKH